MSESDDLIRKLRRPPSVANWVRYNYKRVNDTARALLAFVLGRPRSSLQAVYRIIGDAVHFGRTYEESMRSVAAISSPRTRAMAYEIVPAFFRYNGREKLDGLNVFPGLKENYPVGRNVSIPVEPTFTILKDGQLKPVFVVGWVAVALDDYQKRIMSTIVTESILRLSDFQGSEAIFIFFPASRVRRNAMFVFGRLRTMPRSTMTK